MHSVSAGGKNTIDPINWYCALSLADNIPVDCIPLNMYCNVYTKTVTYTTSIIIIIPFRKV